MTRIQTIFCFSVREPDTALSPLAVHFERVQISIFCYIFVIVDRSKAKTWKCLRGKNLTSNTLKTWRDLAITSAALGRLFDARLVRPPLQAHTKAVQLAKKGQVNNVLPSCKLNETSMLRLQTVVESTLFPRKKIPRLEKLLKPPQGASKLASFDTVLAVRTLAVTFFFLRRACSCRLSASLSSHLTPDHAGAKQHRPSTQQKSLQTPQWWRGSTACTCRIDRVHSGWDHCMRWCVHRSFRRWSFDFGCRTCARLDSNLCVDIGFSSCFEFGHVVLDLFSPLPTRSPPRKYAWQQPTSIVDISAQEPCRFFSRKAGQLWTLNKQPLPIFTSRREQKHPNKRQTNDQTKSFSAGRRRSVLSAPRLRSQPALQRRDFP